MLEQHAFDPPSWTERESGNLIHQYSEQTQIWFIALKKFHLAELKFRLTARLWGTGCQSRRRLLNESSELHHRRSHVNGSFTVMRSNFSLDYTRITAPYYAGERADLNTSLKFWKQRWRFLYPFNFWLKHKVIAAVERSRQINSFTPEKWSSFALERLKLVFLHTHPQTTP